MSNTCVSVASLCFSDTVLPIFTLYLLNSIGVRFRLNFLPLASIVIFIVDFIMFGLFFVNDCFCWLLEGMR